MSRVCLLLAIVLGGCPAPLFSSLHRPEPVAPSRSYTRSPEAGSCPSEAAAQPWRVACLPGDFNAYVASRPVRRVEVQTWDGGRARGPSIRVDGDSARLGDRTLALGAVEALWLYDTTPADRLTNAAVATGTTAALGAGLGLVAGAAHPDATALRGSARGLALGASLGLALAWLADDPGERFEVVGWHNPALVTGPPGLLVTEAEESSRAGWAVGSRACGRDLPPEAGWIGRCVTPAVLTERARADWVRQIDVVLRSGRRLRGRDLTVTDAEAMLDGTRQPLAEVARIELRVPAGPVRVLRPMARGLRTGLGLGVILGAGTALASGDADAIWRTAVVTGSLGAASGFSLGLLRGPDRVRDVTYLPAPGP